MTTTAQTLVLAIFDDEAAADAAAHALVDWVKAEDVVRRPIGVLALDEAGRIKEHKLGRKRSGAKGAGIGAVLAVVAPPTLLAGVVAGGVIGHFHHEGLKLSDAERQRIASELVGGKAAVAYLVYMLISTPIALVGMLLCFIGVYPASTLTNMAAQHLMVQLYLDYLDRGGEEVVNEDAGGRRKRPRDEDEYDDPDADEYDRRR